MLFYGSLERPAFRRSPSGLDPLGLALASDAGRRLPSTFILSDLIALRIALRRARARNYVDKADGCPDFCWLLGGPYNGHLRGDDAYRLSGHREMRSIARFGRPIGYLAPIALACLSTTLNSSPFNESANGIFSLRGAAIFLIFLSFRWIDRSLDRAHTRVMHSWLYSQMPIKASPSCHPSRSVVRQRAHCCRLSHEQSHSLGTDQRRLSLSRTRALANADSDFSKNSRAFFSREAALARESVIRGDPLFRVKGLRLRLRVVHLGGMTHARERGVCGTRVDLT